MWTMNFQMFKLVLEKAEKSEIKLPTSDGSLKKQESSRKKSTSALLTMPKLWLCGSQQSVENSLRDGNTRPPDLPPEKSYAGQEATVRMGHGTTDWSKLGREYIKAVYCHPAYLTYMHSTAWEILHWINTRGNQDCQEKYQKPHIYRWHHPYDRKQRTTKELMKVKEESEKVGLKLNIQKT